MDGYIVHTKSGFFLGAFLDFHEANAFAYKEQPNNDERVLVSKESAFRRKYLRETGMEERVLNRTLEFMSR